MDNPLLTQSPLPMFSNIHPEDIEPALKHLISQNRARLTALLTQKNFTWDNLMAPMEDMSDQLSQFWSPISHLHSVLSSPALREAYNICLPLLTEYHTELMHNETLYQAIQSIANSPDFAKLDVAQRKIIENDLRDLKLAGVNLPPTEKTRFGELQKQLSHLTTQFSENLLDATYAWTLHVTDQESLKGLPDSFLKLAEQNAKERELTGWVFTLDYSCYSTVMKYLANRELRWLMYEAYSTRASDQGPHAHKNDNSQIIEDIMRIRHELATLLGFKDFAEYSLKTKMAKTPQRVLSFLNELVEKSKVGSQKEIKELSELAKTLDNIDQLEAWDIAYYSEKLREQKYAISQEELRVYFPIDTVLAGMFTFINRLYGLTIVERKNVDTWHPHVQYFEIVDEKNESRGSFYIDLYSRPHKREGAWMDECRVRRRLANGQIQSPIAYLTCNFTRPIGNKPALLTHEEVMTLFHEFGHCLHHLVTKVDYAPLSGINGVPWDAVEFPSQFMEFWCYEKSIIAYISGHEETHEPLPDMLYNKLLAAKNFQSGLQMLRQLEFALFDFRIHLEYDPNAQNQVQSILNDVRKKVSLINVPSFNRFQHSFSHIFSGAYAAGYYSYKWAEVLSSDAFQLFEEKGLMDKATGRSFLTNILEKGGVYEPMDLYVAFRGREPTIDALLKYSGL